MFILYCVSHSKGLFCFMQFGKECNYFRVICLFFLALYNKQKKTLFLLSFYLHILFHAVFFISCFFLLQQDFVNCWYSANLKILKTKVNMTATRFEPCRSILIHVVNLLRRVYKALKNINYSKHKLF